MLHQMRGRRFAVAAAAATAVGMLVAGCGGGSGASHGAIMVWHGYTNAEAAEMPKLAAQWNAAHPTEKVQLVFDGGNDGALQKTLSTFVAGDPPAVAYEYGSSAVAFAKRPQTVDLTSLVNQPSFNWNDFYPGERQAATVDGKIVGVPALVDNLGLVYNKKLFDQAHLAYPTANWTWTDFTNAVERLSDPAAKQYGWYFSEDGAEDTVWEYLAALWQAGGDLLTADNKHAAFDSPAGLASMNLLQRLSAHDHAVYLDDGSAKYMNVFNSGKLAMMWTGPWDLSSINKNISYGTQILPADKSHASISGPDNYMMFNKGDAKRAWPFLAWLSSPDINLQFSTATGDLPLRQSESKLPGYQTYLQKYPGVKTFVDNLQNVTKSRPNIAQYPKVSQALGTAIQEVLLGRKQPQAALDEARGQVDQILSQS